jgi:hypothetical protein
MAGLKVVAVKTHDDGNLDLEDLKAKAEEYKDNLAAFMVCLRLFSPVLGPDLFLGRSHTPRLSVCSRPACRMYSPFSYARVTC